MDIFTLPSYREVMELLDSYTNFERSAPTPSALERGTERMSILMKRLGSPQAAIPALHIAGTKGKGSASNLAAAALIAAGFKTGLYTSPHIENMRERIAIQGKPIGEQRFVEACMTVLREAEAMREAGQAPSYFEILTATAFVAFKAAGVEAMVLETGLGGRLDATNMPELRLAAIGLAAVSRDHEEILGHDLKAIAAEKAAIIRPGIPAVTVPQAAEAMQVIVERAHECDSQLFVVGRDVKVGFRKHTGQDRPGSGQRLDLETWRNVYPDVPLGLLGAHQAANAGLALGLVDLFLEYMDRDPLDSLILKRAWRGISLPARLEVVESEPWHIVDGAHNPASAWAAAETVLESFSATDRTLVFGVADDKDWRTMLRILAPLFKHIVLTPYDSPRAADVAELAAFLSAEHPGVKIASAIDPAHALELATEFTPRDGLILTAGSLYLAGEVRALCRKDKSDKCGLQR